MELWRYIMNFAMPAVEWCSIRRDDIHDVEDSVNVPEESDTVSYVKGEQQRFVSPDHHGGIVKELCKQRDERRFLDCTVITKEGSVRAHQAMLAAASQYFDGLLRFKQEQVQEQTMRTVDLSNLDHKAVVSLIDYAYRGDILIALQNVRELLHAADFLCMTELSAACVKYIANNLAVDDCFETLRFAKSINNASLIEEIKIFLARRFSHFVSRNEFLQLDPMLFMYILESDELVMTQTFTHGEIVSEFFINSGKQEELILKAAMDYIAFDPTRSAKDVLLYQILSQGVRLPLIPVEILKRCRNDEMFVEWKDAVAVFDKMIEMKTREAAASAEIKASTKVIELPPEKRGVPWVKKNSGDALEAILTSERQTRPRSLSTMRIKLTAELAGHIKTGGFPNGSVFDDSRMGIPVQYVTGMKMYRRCWDVHIIIGGLLVTYNNEESILHGSDSDAGFEAEEFTLEQDERITGISIQTRWMIDSLKFTTSMGNVFGPYGGKFNSLTKLARPCSSAYLSYIKGRVQDTYGVPAVRHIQFGWAYNEALVSPRFGKEAYGVTGDRRVFAD